MTHNWDELPWEILMEIAKLLTKFKDYAPFSGVCTSWQSAAACLYPIPSLMVTPRKDNNVLDFYHLSDRVVNQVSLSEALTGKRRYSSKGCLIIIGHDLNVNLMHPFSNLQHKFLNIKTIDNWDESFDSSCYERFIEKCVLSSNPLLESDYILMVIFGGFIELVYARPRDETWTFVSKRFDYFDVTYYRGQFYTVNPHGQITDCYIGGGDNPSEPEVVAELPSKFVENFPSRLYITESVGALLIILQFVYSESQMQKKLKSFHDDDEEDEENEENEDEDEDEDEDDEENEENEDEDEDDEDEEDDDDDGD
ncbi:hypothetical protein Ddye_031313 [Dipteronia dyeriana]|uniref:KIB1-4 beta-propeller domain-containing protein n=1 Tax=Dipteronia dyeriana TaxID=168575 RepID=A0AAD9TIB3_9ROSI|nr:hypothetical protein Ddye_031313 [Dipteronia dyeriana]